MDWLVEDDEALYDSDFASNHAKSTGNNTSSSNSNALEGSGPVRGPWIVSARFDAAMFGLPPVLALLTALALVWDSRVETRHYFSGMQLTVDVGQELKKASEQEEALEVLTNPGIMPVWAFLFIVVAFDVAHVWATSYRIYTDKEELQRRWYLYMVPIPVSFFGSFFLHWHSPVLFWSLLAYIAVWHFVKQPFGFISLYKARRGAIETGRFDHYLDMWTTWCGGLCPILMWHGNPKRVFDWFNATESFLFRVPPAVMPLVYVIYAVTALTYILRQAQRYRHSGFFNTGKNMVMFEVWVSWQLGVASPNTVMSAACLNLFHGLPFFMLVWFYCVNKYKNMPKGSTAGLLERFMRFVSSPSHYVWFFLAAFVPALIEEVLWDVKVWHQYAPGNEKFDPADLATPATSFWVALLSVPQIVHYFLDNFIWKFDGTNPDLRQNLRL